MMHYEHETEQPQSSLLTFLPHLLLYMIRPDRSLAAGRAKKKKGRGRAWRWRVDSICVDPCVSGRGYPVRPPLAAVQVILLGTLKSLPTKIAMSQLRSCFARLARLFCYSVGTGRVRGVCGSFCLQTLVDGKRESDGV